MDPVSSVKTANIASVETQKGSSPALKKACAEFESVFVYMMLQEMGKSVPRNEGYLGDSSEGEIYQDMLNQELAVKMSGLNGMGLARILEQQLQQQETQDNKNSK